jgi:hypothetical protein
MRSHTAFRFCPRMGVHLYSFAGDGSVLSWRLFVLSVCICIYIYIYMLCVRSVCGCVCAECVCILF